MLTYHLGYRDVQSNKREDQKGGLRLGFLILLPSLLSSFPPYLNKANFCPYGIDEGSRVL